MRFRTAQTMTAPVAAVEQALTDPAFYASLDGLTKIGAPQVLGTETTPDGVVQRVRYRFIADLPGAVSAVVDPAKLTWIEEAHYDLVAHTSAHAIHPDHYADRLQGSYACTLVADGPGTRRTITGDVSVHVALVHAKVEHVIVDGLEDFVSEQAEHLDRWLEDRA